MKAGRQKENTEQMNILLTNDDGLFAPGIAAMFQELTKLGDVYVVAPMVEQSGVSQALTFRTPLNVQDVLVDGKRWGWGVNGSPADCVKIGVHTICPQKPDIVVSGINKGQNCGTNILYSGTLGAAFEGAFMGITSFAVSELYDGPGSFQRTAEIACELIAQICEKLQTESPRLDPCGNPEAQIYNINVPRAALHEANPQVVVTSMDTTPYNTELDERVNTFDRPYYWLKPSKRHRHPERLTDMNALFQGQVSVTPLVLDRTNYERLETMNAWNLRVTSPPQATEPVEQNTNTPSVQPPSVRFETD